MAHPRISAPANFRRRAIGAACLTALASVAHAQATDGTALPAVTVRAQEPVSPTSLTGFGNKPLVSVPVQATVISRNQLDETQARRLADILVFEASATDAYNSPGYWDFIAVRGFTLDQTYNYRREGLPISAETTISLQNKERVEILKGTSGIQAGTSAPGGLVNYIVKRPTAAPLRNVSVTTGERGTLGAAVDLGGRAGDLDRFGYRLNVAYENAKPEIAHYDHLESSLGALATDWRITPDSLLEAEIEWSHQVGKSLPGFSLTGSTLPQARKPDNLNNQPWSQPNQFDGLTGTLRFDQRLARGWRWVSQLGTQRLKTNDRLAYPFGSDCGGAGYCDRYGDNGDYDVYDFRSENEHRRVHAGQTSLKGRIDTGAVRHELNGGVLVSRLRADMQEGANNYVGVGNIDGTKVTPADPTIGTNQGTDRTERSVELFVNDAIDWGHGFSTWLGLRHARLNRESIRTDGSDPTRFKDNTTTPWLAGSYEWHPRQHVYASWGKGAESYALPGNAGGNNFENAGQSLLAKTRQWEVGTKGQHETTEWGLSYFDVKRPPVNLVGTELQLDGENHHRGIDGNIAHAIGPWHARVGAMFLKARREGAADPTLNGVRPTNVPERTLKAQLRYRVAAVPGLDLQTNVTHEGRRMVLADNSIELPSWTRTDVAGRFSHRLDGTTLTWTLGVLNVFDRRAWKESPNQYGHVYLFPLEARTVRLTMLAEL